MTYDEKSTQNDATTISGRSSIDILNRALLYCPTNFKLQMQRLREAYSRSYPLETISSYLKSAERAADAAPEAATKAQFLVTIFREYIAFLKRLVDTEQLSIVDLQSHLKWYGQVLQSKQCDKYDAYIRFAAEILYELNEFDRGHDRFSVFMTNPHNFHKAALWIDFARLARANGIETVRK